MVPVAEIFSERRRQRMRSLRSVRLHGSGVGEGEGVGRGEIEGFGVGWGVGAHASDVDGSGVSTSGQSSVIVQVLVFAPSIPQPDHAVHSQASAVHGAAQDCVTGGIGSSAFGQSKRSRQEREAMSSVQVDQKVQYQVSLTHSLSARVRVVWAIAGSTLTIKRPIATATKILRYTEMIIVCSVALF